MNPGYHNLLRNCAALTSDETVLIVHEDPALGWYDDSIIDGLSAAVRELGIEPTIIAVGLPSNTSDQSIAAAVAGHDCTLYLARIGDQDRFGVAPTGTRSVMCYARDDATMLSTFCTSDYHAFKALKQAVDKELGAAKRVRITCPLGTDLSGELPPGRHASQDDVATFRFPLGVPTPVLADTFHGQVALAHYLTPTGNRVYAPDSVRLPATTMAKVSDGRILDFVGNDQTVNDINSHYQRVADLFDIEAMRVHSWHAGIHPACAYLPLASTNPDRWSNTVFGNPHFVHFHTCGNYPPGEICWMVRDPTIQINGVALWQDGRLMLDQFEATATCAREWPILQTLAQTENPALGL